MLSAEDAGHSPRPPPPPIPPSPTLSNPDMILPFDHNERESSTPSPPFNLPSLSNLQSFYENRTAPDDVDDQGRGVGSAGIALSYGSRPQKIGFARRMWPSEVQDSSRRLSDIGEEDSVSSSPAHMRTLPFLSQAGRIAGSPVSQRETAEAEAREMAAWSSSSSSTISGASDSSQDAAKDRQGSRVTVQNSHQVPEGVRSAIDSLEGNGSTPSLMATTEKGGSGVELSSAVLSTEAERILENAKKRLTLMEGNLSRARTSMRASPSLSASPTPSVGHQPLGLGQPVGGLYQSISRADRRGSANRPRATYTSSPDAINNNGHSRVHSETNLPSAAQSSLPAVERNLSRSVSALGSTTAPNLHHDERSFRYDPTRAYLTHRASVSSMQRPQIRSSPPVSNPRAASDSPKGLGISEEVIEDESSETMNGPNSVQPTYEPPSRSQSQLQVRDLQDQMKGLHIKISSLKVRAQEDNLRRRSMQSLRTPSPLSATDQWAPSAAEVKERRTNIDANTGNGRSAGYTQDSQHRSDYGSARYEPEVCVSRQTSLSRQTSQRKRELPSTQASHAEPNYGGYESREDDDDGKSVAGTLYEDAEEGEYYINGADDGLDRQALDEILREPLDDEFDDSLEAFPAAPQSLEDTPHEEREDAFDYEHFILHSALGNYTQARLRRESNVSTSSVETTRPIDHRSIRHSRANSTTSISTVATFATATEGDRDDLESVLYWDRKFNDELRNNHPSDVDDSNGAQYGDDEETPRAIRRQPSRRDKASLYPETNLPPRRSDSATTGSTTPTSLVSSLVSTVRAASSPHPSATAKGNLGLNDDDTHLLERLFQSLGNVCLDLQNITTSENPDPKQVRLLRRRLDAARRVLNGELDT
ncbi:hypothetical protein BO83DRAFT_365844 [Aspergillus eucalypticola CBS 122712]|uniref:Uncharacterized protein n=1 Tax=Aspergillus eucalypticola (strain CBS 122712 / IBT 29274) TaxID=1448314 RepID=A0A317UZ01_ASPEC|nr:uncharacterized protein BO83DRAFT_365844 [Aspergillus eucalypticola CBS 122712]PWY67293.1 hypothetical protein BO83DRAFT_365844 [Aspergillus eucalypticola CBS 122712]